MDYLGREMRLVDTGGLDPVAAREVVGAYAHAAPDAHAHAAPRAAIRTGRFCTFGP